MSRQERVRPCASNHRRSDMRRWNETTRRGGWNETSNRRAEGYDGQDSIFRLIGRSCGDRMKLRPRAIYLTTSITGKSRAMVVNGDSALIAGIPKINLFRERTDTWAPKALATSPAVIVILALMARQSMARTLNDVVLRYSFHATEDLVLLSDVFRCTRRISLRRNKFTGETAPNFIAWQYSITTEAGILLMRSLTC